MNQWRTKCRPHPCGASLPALFALAFASPSHAQEAAEATDATEAPASEDAAALPEAEAPKNDAGQTIVGRRRDARRVAGSAHTIDKETLERFEPDDVQRALRTVPGVYVRDEDGNGLRPNIGLRGASSDRSAKVVLMEDGVLFAPAPYAAPAAYYFPLATRMTGVEVFKGPASIRQGPHTVGGAINMRTRLVPTAPMAFVDAGAGLVAPERGQSRLHGGAGVGAETWGFFIEGARVASDGFKHIDNAPDTKTGFVRDDVMLKARIGSSFLDEVRGNLELKLGVQREESNETYLGLSDADFRADPDRRYAASALDRMRWGRTQAQLRWTLSMNENLDVDVVAYRHDLDRTWNKVNGVRGAPNLHDVLTFADAGAFPLFVAKLRGEESDDGVVDGGANAILIGPNQRRFYSQGLAARAGGSFVLGEGAGAVAQRIEIGARIHNDSVDRQHAQRAFSFIDGQLVDRTTLDPAESVEVTAGNQASAVAFAAHVADEVRFADFVVVPGARVEVIHGTFRDFLPGATSGVVASDQVALLPGIGAAWQPWRQLVVIAGVHRGFSPIAPGQSSDVRPEESTSFEAGVRLDGSRELGLSGEAIGFYSHYENILGECTYSSGCIDDVGSQTNGGTASIAGAELLARHVLPLPVMLGEGALLRSEASYTFTHAVFLTSFDSAHPLFGRVTAGDEMAYVPAHRAAFMGSVSLNALDLGISVGLESAMRDVPGQGEAPAVELTDPQAVVDAAASFTLAPGVRIGVRADNVLDQRAIVSRRPFGARPNKPRSVMVSLELETL